MPQVTSTPIKQVTSNTEKSVSVSGYTSVTFDIAGTASSATVSFSIIAGSGKARPVYPTKVSGDLDITQTGLMNEIYNFDVTGITTVVINVTDITGGNVDVYMTGVS